MTRPIRATRRALLKGAAAAGLAASFPWRPAVAQSQALKIGVLLPRSGYLAQAGQACQHGVDIATEVLADMGYKVEITSLDFESNVDLSRTQAEEKPREQMRFGDLLIDMPRHVASWKGKPMELTATEFKLLTVLAQRSGRVQSRDQLLRDVWEYDTLIDTRTVDTHMRRLREKIGAASKHLDTVRGVGYRFVE